MQCEICGREFKGKGFKIIVEGAELNVCPNCQKFGTSPKTRHKIPLGGDTARRKTPFATTPAGPRRKTERDLELVEDYNTVVKNAREKRKMSQGDLGKKINEKESLIHRIETKSMRPSTKVARKLEKALDITLLEASGIVEAGKIVSGGQALTIGDIIKFKK
ncbi:MAG: multiprotein bridging factor aMBF1 [Candidatus Methanofastidiosia archaeon]